MGEFKGSGSGKSKMAFSWGENSSRFVIPGGYLLKNEGQQDKRQRYTKTLRIEFWD